MAPETMEGCTAPSPGIHHVLFAKLQCLNNCQAVFGLFVPGILKSIFFNLNNFATPCLG